MSVAKTHTEIFLEALRELRAQEEALREEHQRLSESIRRGMDEERQKEVAKARCNIKEKFDDLFEQEGNDEITH